MLTEKQVENLKFLIGDDLDCDAESIKEISPEKRRILKSSFTDNLQTVGVFYTNDLLIFTREDTFKSWQYYAGLEYVKSVWAMMKKQNDFIAVYTWSSDDRIERILSKLEDQE